ncbi:UNKNOWN [Stylonychia lemnae]|uniref:Tpr domain containing protein n=1 Tax=Stylonychia lemnae TaxID=5949 RepID=A0A077ZSV9_STYLE|nr:UNKNOWN [Stylonychia lemnae]|eukprot:CDW72972.1 UNKNOWN [Stylonychia lemnae]
MEKATIKSKEDLLSNNSKKKYIKKPLTPILNDEDCNKYERLSKELIKTQKYLKSLAYINEIIKYKKQSSIDQNEEFLNIYVYEMTKTFNSYGMQMLNTESYVVSLKIFKTLLRIIADMDSLRVKLLKVLTLNNLSCCYKKHQTAKEYAFIAVGKIELELENLRMQQNLADQQEQMRYQNIYNEKISLLAIANYNLGCQNEFLNEYQDAIIRYEIALSLIQNLPNTASLENDFRLSIKSIKARFQAYKMKGPNRTFTNLNKYRSELEHLQINNIVIPGSMVSSSKSNSINKNNRIKKIRPMSAQVKKISSQQKQKLNSNEKEKNETYQPEIISQQTQMNSNNIVVQRKQRPTSSYVHRDKAGLIRTNQVTQSHSNFRSTNVDQLTQNQEDSLDRNFQGSQLQFSDQKFNPSTQASQKFLKNSQFQLNNMNILEDELDEVKEDPDQNNEDYSIHPLMIQRRSVIENQAKLFRPISAKTNVSNGQKSNIPMRNNNFGYQSHTLQSNNQRSNESQEGKSQVERSPIKFNNTNQNISLKQFRLRQSDKLSTSHLNLSGIESSHQLYEIIDKSLNQIDPKDIVENTNTSSLSLHRIRPHFNSDLNDLYARESLIQQEIFYYNNHVLPTFVGTLNLKHQSRPDIPKGSNPYSSSYLQNQQFSLENRNYQLKKSSIQQPQIPIQIDYQSQNQLKQPRKFTQKSIKQGQGSKQQFNKPKPSRNFIQSQTKSNQKSKSKDTPYFSAGDHDRYQVTIQSCQDRTKQIIRNIDLSKLKLQQSSFNNQNDLDKNVIARFKEHLKSPTGDMHQDFLHLGIPLSFRGNSQEINDHKIDLISAIGSHLSKSFAQLQQNHVQSQRSNISLNRSLKELNNSIKSFPNLPDESQISVIKPNYQDNTVDQNKSKVALMSKIEKIIKIQTIMRIFLAKKILKYKKEKAKKDDLIETYRKKFYLDVENIKFCQISLYEHKAARKHIIKGKFIDKDQSKRIIDLDINVSIDRIFDLQEFKKFIKNEIILKKFRGKLSQGLQNQNDLQTVTLFEFNIPLIDKFLSKQDQLKIASDRLHKSLHGKFELQKSNQVNSSNYRIANSQLGIFDHSKLTNTKGSPASSTQGNNNLGVPLGANKIQIDYSIGDIRNAKQSFQNIDDQYSFRGNGENLGDISYQNLHNHSTLIDNQRDLVGENLMTYTQSSRSFAQDSRRNRIKMIKRRSKYSYVIDGEIIKRNGAKKESVWDKFRKEQEDYMNIDDNIEFVLEDADYQARVIQKWFRRIMFKRRIIQKIANRGNLGIQIERRKKKNYGKRSSILEEIDELHSSHKYYQSRNSMILSLKPSPIYEKIVDIEDQNQPTLIIAQYDVKVYQKDSNTVELVYRNQSSPNESQQNYDFKIPQDDIEAFENDKAAYLYQVVSDCMQYNYDLKIFKLDEESVKKIDKNLNQKLSHLQGKIRGKMQRNRMDKIKKNPFEQEQKKAQQKQKQNNKVNLINNLNKDQAETQVSTSKFQIDDDLVINGIEKLQDLNSNDFKQRAIDNDNFQKFIKFNVLDHNQSKILIEASLNFQKMLLILQAQNYNTLSVYVTDFITKYYKGSHDELNSKDKIQQFIMSKLPQVTQLDQNKKIILKKNDNSSLPQQSLQVPSNDLFQSVEVITSSDFNDRSLNQDELKDLLKSTVNQGENSIHYKFQGSPTKTLNKKNILFNFNFPGIKFEHHPDTNMNALLFKDIMDNVFLRITYDKLPKYAFVERINKERVQKLSGTKVVNLQQLSDSLLQELNIRIGLVNGGLEQNEFMDLKQIENMIKLYGFDTSEKDLDKIQSMQCIIKKTRLIQNAFRKKNKRKNQIQQQPDQKDITGRQLQGTTQLDLKPQIKQDSKQKLTLSQRQNRYSNAQVSNMQQDNNQIVNLPTKTVNLNDLKKKIGQFTIIKSKTNISGQYCTAELKANYDNDTLILRVTPQSKPSLELLLPNMNLQAKDLEKLTSEGQGILDKIEISEDQKSLEIRNGKNDYSILSQDVIYKQGHVIQGRFMLLTVAMENKHLIIDAYEEKTEKRLEIKIKRQKRQSNSDTINIPSEKEIKKLISRLDICKISLDENDDLETLTLKSNLS